MIQDENLMEFFQGKFDYERTLSCATPSGNYFWYRKRQEVVKLIDRNINIILNQRDDLTSSLFVDIGCGEGVDIFLISDVLNKHSSKWNLIGVEAVDSSLKICNLKKKYYQADNISFLPCDITNPLPFKDAEVDVLYCSEVIEHILDPESFLLELKRVIKPNGYLILTTPNEPNVFQRSYWSRNPQQKIQAEALAMKEQPQQINIETQNVFLYGHISLRTISQWDNTLDKIGFKIVDCGRGAVTYGATPFFDNEWILGTRFLLEAVLDMLPRWWVRNFSDQLIGLYKLDE